MDVELKMPGAKSVYTGLGTDLRGWHRLLVGFRFLPRNQPERLGWVEMEVV